MFKLIVIVILSFLFVFKVNAYVGPGMGGGLIAATLGIVIAIFAAVFALLWFPIKKLLKKNKKINLEDQDTKEN
jgi:hypothetical protein